MKKFLCVFLSILFLLLTSCSYKTEKQNSSEKTTINSDNSEIASAPHSNISAEQLTNEQAREILEVLIPKQFEVFFCSSLILKKLMRLKLCPETLGTCFVQMNVFLVCKILKTIFYRFIPEIRQSGISIYI